ncbi:MAG: valine--tRNA ligase, partial [Gemmatimonadetes bacterium]
MPQPTFELAPQYRPREVEAPLYARWVESGLFAPRADGEPYVIVMPPPNITAVLHTGQGLNNVIQDVLIRFERMRGRAALWLPGTDHAGIATQNVVERLVAKEGTTRFDLGREKFIERVWTFVRENGTTILEQLKVIGSSCDWSRTTGSLYYIRYPVEGGPAPFLTVATTRPETLLGDTAVAVSPKDKRHRGFVGKTARLPLTNLAIPIVADDAVDPKFGTGFVKVTPAHDPNDFEIGLRHGLAMPLVMTEDGRMGEPVGQSDGRTVGPRVPQELQGVDRFEARKKIVAMLKAQGLLEKVEPHQHAVRHCYRCGTVVEPRLSDQWFVKMKPLAEPVLAAYRDGRFTIVPERWHATFEHWMENIRDWNISRQLWWGHRIPVFTCTKCQHTWADRKDPKACPK